MRRGRHSEHAPDWESLPCRKRQAPWVPEARAARVWEVAQPWGPVVPTPTESRQGRTEGGLAGNIAREWRGAGTLCGLCAASKLWVILGLPTPICDSLAREQLQFNPTAKEKKPYGRFHETWMAAFKPVRADFQAAADEHGLPSTTLVGYPVGREWFLMRAFDQYLIDAAKDAARKKKK